MEEIILQQKQVIATLFKDKMVPVFLNKTTAHHVAMQKIEILQQKITEKKQKPQNKFDTFKELNTYKTALENCITTYFDTLSNEALFFNTYFEALDTHLTTLDETIIRTQDQERFVGLELDSKVLKFKKALKYNAFKVSKIPLKTINLFKKSKKEIVFWKQEIPFKNITSHYFKTNLVADLAIVNDVVNKEITQITEAYWLVDRAIDVAIENYLNDESEISFPDDLFLKLADLPSLETILEQQKILLNDIFENTSINYTNALYKADTIELSANSFQLKKIENHLKNTEEKSSKNQKLWQNTFNVLESDWELDIEIYKIIFNLMFTYNTLENSISKRIENVYLELEEIKKYLSETKATIANTENNKAVKQTIIAQIKKDTKAFKKIIDETTKRISNQELPLQINYFEENALQVLQTLSKKRAISSDTDYTTKTATTSINYISPFEIVSYQSWPNLAAQIKEAKLDLSSKVTTFIEDINAINQVNEFNLESALSLFETETQENTSKENTPKKVALEGLGRSEEKVEELKNTLTELNTTNANLLLPSIDKFNKSILELTDTENILEIRLTIAKAKSIEKSKLLKKQFINNVKNFVPVAVGYTKNKYTKTAVRIKNLLIRTGLYKETANVDSHLSDFLKQAEKALGALPYVYQRLFRSETLQNEALFIGRKAALQTLDEAYQTFQKKHYAATIIIGERGSGKTSVIYHFLEQNKKTPKTVFLNPEKNINQLDDFITFLNTSFNQNYATLQEWITFFNTGKKRTVILEDIQYLYFRKVGGFNLLYQVAELISATKTKVFWILTSSKYAYQYLDKAIQLSEFFAFNVEMNEIDKQTLTEALIKRHKISGYNLHFQKPPVAYLTKKFLKSTPEEQQETLKEDFFSDINKIAQSNFRIAFMYWIRSTVKVSGSTIYMRSLKNIDTSFLNKLAPVKLLLLNSILLQERLTIEEIVELSSLSKQQTTSMVHSLLENGLLTIENDCYYTINIFLYRQITSLLKSKNVIH